MLLGLSGQPLQAEVQKALRAFVVLWVAVSRFLGFRGFGLGFRGLCFFSCGFQGQILLVVPFMTPRLVR